MQGSSLVIILIGLVIALLSATADLTGLGEGPGFGLWQVGGLLIGGLFMAAGWLLGKNEDKG
jgi:hypothetical protein